MDFTIKPRKRGGKSCPLPEAKARNKEQQNSYVVFIIKAAAQFLH